MIGRRRLLKSRVGQKHLPPGGMEGEITLMKRNARSNAVVVGLLAGLAVAGCRGTPVSSARPDAEPETVRIGALLPLSGKKAPIGMQQKWAFELAQEKLNAEDGVKVKFVFEDTKNDAKVGEAGARKLIEEQDVAFVFAFPCAIVYKVQPIVDKGGALLMACNLDPKTSEASPRTFRVFPSLRQQAPVMLKHLGKGNKRRAAIIHLEAPAPNRAIGELVPVLKAEGWQIMASTSYDLKSPDYGAAVAPIEAAKPDVLFMYVDKGSVPPLLKLIRKSPSLSRTKLVGGVGFAFPFKMPPQMLEGITVVAPTCALSDRRKLHGSWFGQEFRKRHAKPPHMFAGFCFDGAMLLGNALREKGTDVADVQAYFRKVAGYPGVTGSLTLDKSGDAKVSWAVGVYKGGKLVPVPK